MALESRQSLISTSASTVDLASLYSFGTYTLDPPSTRIVPDSRDFLGDGLEELSHLDVTMMIHTTSGAPCRFGGVSDIYTGDGSDGARVRSLLIIF